MNFLSAQATESGDVITLTGNGFTIKLPKNGRIDTVPEHAIVGVHFDVLTGVLIVGEYVIQMTVKVREPLGNELPVYAD